MILMGIVNLTPDSFWAPSRVDGAEELRARVDSLLGRGCGIIDFGAVSTRPGAAGVSVEEEWRRLAPAVTYLQTAGKPSPTASLRFAPPSASLMVPPLSRGWRRSCEGLPAVSVDTTSAEIVRRFYEAAGPFIVNDISAGEDDPGMLETVAELGLPYIAMHKRGDPRTMDGLSDYPRGIVPELLDYFEAFSAAAEKAGIRDWILDPGFGFAKNPEQNWELLENLPAFRRFGRPILVGVADKRFTHTPNPFGPEQNAERLAELRGADILRIH